jgi:hypothetical protein
VSARASSIGATDWFMPCYLCRRIEYPPVVEYLPVKVIAAG